MAPDGDLATTGTAGVERAAPGEVRVRRALLSVSEKAGIVDFARGLEQLGVEIVSTGGTAHELARAGIAVRGIEDFTGFPEVMDGRVKTLHPRLYAGLLARRDEDMHLQAAAALEIEPVDLVCVNLYPFEQTVARGDASEQEVIENIDIGGPTMIRAAAQNPEFAAVVVDPEDYERLLGELRDRKAQQPLRMRGGGQRPARLRACLRVRPAERLRRRDRAQPARRPRVCRAAVAAVHRGAARARLRRRRARAAAGEEERAPAGAGGLAAPAACARKQARDRRRAGADARRRLRDARADAGPQLEAADRGGGGLHAVRLEGMPPRALQRDRDRRRRRGVRQRDDRDRRGADEQGRRGAHSGREGRRRAA